MRRELNIYLTDINEEKRKRDKEMKEYKEKITRYIFLSIVGLSMVFFTWRASANIFNKVSNMEKYANDKGYYDNVDTRDKAKIIKRSGIYKNN